MNETNHTPEDRESWADALVDRGLRESLGQETPPDLRERILAAASQEGTLTPSTLEDAKMADHNSPRPARRIAYALLAAAGCVLIAITVWPALQANREAARRAPATDASTVTGDESQDSRDLERGLKATAKPTGPTTDDDTTILSAGVANDASQAESDQLMMLATPHIIIQEEEEVRLGLTVEGAVVDETPQPQNNVGLEGLLNDAYGSPRVQGSGVPFRQGSFGAPAPEVANGTDGVVASDRGYAGVAGDSALVDRSGQAANGNELATLPQGPPNGGVQGGRQQIPTPYYLLDDVQYGIGPEFHPSNAGIQGAPNNRLQWGDYQTPGQTRERYAERGATGADSQRLVELQDNQKFLQAEIAQLAQRGETVSAADRQQAALANDPMIANYRQQLFAVDNMIMQRRAIERRADSPEVQRLQQSKKEIETMLAAYERKLAEDLVDLDVSVTTEQVLAARRQRLETWQRELVRVEQELRELQQDQGQGPAAGGDQYARIYDNPFKPVSAANTDNRLSTFSIDVDTAAYANVRQFLMQSGQLPPADAVRIEELVNYFDYDYAAPTDETPFAANVETAACPWNDKHRLVRIGIKGREMDRRARPLSNLVFLVDVSGSMNEPNKLPLVVEGLRMLAEELSENDRVAIVVYASSEGLALPSTPGTQRKTITDALDKLRAGGSTAGGAGIQLAYKIAQDNFITDGVNRVILCTDGDFNVGVTSPAELERMAETKAKETGVFLTVLGFGRGNLNDAMMEQISGKGNGNYYYVDNRTEAHKVLVEEITGTLVTIAKDVKLQVEFNPAQVAGYRLIGYENRVLAAEDFNDDTKDAGEIGAGHTVTALYEVVPAGQPLETPTVDPLKYGVAGSPPRDGLQPNEWAYAASAEDFAANSDELLTLKIRYKQPDGDTSTKLEFPVTDTGQSFAEASDDFQFAAAVASFGMLLRNSPHKGQSSFAAVAEIAESASRDRDPHGRRKEFVELVNRAAELTGE